MIEEKPSTLAEWMEIEIQEAIYTAGKGVGIAVVALIIFSILKLFLTGNYRVYATFGIGVAIGIAVILILHAVYRVSRIKAHPSVPFTCPYCDAVNKMLSIPMNDFECEHCRRLIRFENGVVAPVKVVQCGKCDAEYRVSVKANRYVCDKCGAEIQVKPLEQEQTETAYIPTKVKSGVMLGGPNQIVSLTGYDPYRVDQVAKIIRAELGIAINDALQMVKSANPETPLIVAYDMPESDALVLADQLKQVGGQVKSRAV